MYLLRRALGLARKTPPATPKRARSPNREADDEPPDASSRDDRHQGTRSDV